ncbi:alcohol dehydrogenase [Mytilinidion resinicola]|uniref:Alcohol dehydrogenase n=1 Tax=Mytilinidion resinicola TaxID=574789 RepID=A0A6A6Y1Z8_9PEZI|nr:alcohol dehydrogenase [Mytilinidion resinicola]KAF2802841.1 alcohol dehydrogenase [Mytilinidion resinicola]
MTASRTTRALVLRKYDGTLELETLNVTAPGPKEVLVEMHASGICHTDLTCMKEGFPVPYILGHEGAGTILEVGSDLTSKFSPGESVLLTFNHCGACTACSSAHPAYCQNFIPYNMGGRRLTDGTFFYNTQDSTDPSHVLGGFFGQSSFASHAIVQENSLIKVPKDTNLALLAPLGCGIQTGAGCVINTLAVKKGSSIAIFGAGAVGLSALIAAKNVSASPIIAVDLVESRLDLAQELGATHVFKGDDKNLAEEIRKLTAMTGGVQYGIDATGVVPVIELMIDVLGILGKAATVGVTGRDKKVAVDATSLMSQGKSYVGCTEGDSNPPEFIPYLASEIAAGRFPIKKLVKTYPVAEYQTALADMRSGKTLKPVLLWK